MIASIVAGYFFGTSRSTQTRLLKPGWVVSSVPAVAAFPDSQFLIQDNSLPPSQSALRRDPTISHGR